MKNKHIEVALRAARLSERMAEGLREEDNIIAARLLEEQSKDLFWLAEELLKEKD